MCNLIYQNAAIRFPWDTSSNEVYLPFDPAKRETAEDWPSQPHTMIGTRRLDNVQELVTAAITAGTPGDLITVSAATVAHCPRPPPLPPPARCSSPWDVLQLGHFVDNLVQLGNQQLRGVAADLPVHVIAVRPDLADTRPLGIVSSLAIWLNVSLDPPSGLSPGACRNSRSAL